MPLEPPSSREFKERSEAMQRGGQQASGYYDRSIQNEDARRANFERNGRPWLGGDQLLGQRSEANRPSGAYTTSLPQMHREFKERSEDMQRGGQQASGYYDRSIPIEEARRSDFERNGPPGQGGGQLPGQRSEVNRPSGVYTTSLPEIHREFKERADVIQRGNQQASGYYHKTIRNEDARRSEFDVVSEDTHAEQNSPSRHPIQRGQTQASGSFHRTIHNDDVNPLDPWNDRAPVSSQAPFSNERVFQRDQEPQGGQTHNYYWSSRRDADDVQEVSGRDPQGHITTSGRVQPTWTSIPEADQTNTKVLDRVFEWEPTMDGHAGTHRNIPILSQERQGEREPEVLNRNQNPDVLLHPESLLQRPFTPTGRNNYASDQLSPHQPSQYDVTQANANAPISRQPLAPAPPDPNLQFAPPTINRLKKREKDGTPLSCLILLGVVILCFLLAVAAVVIMVEAL